MRINYIHPTPLKYSGGGVRLHYIADGLAKKGHEVCITTPKWKKSDQYEEHSYSLIEIDAKFAILKPASILHFAATAYTANQNYDVVDVTDPTPLPLLKNKHSPLVVRTVNELYGAKHYFEESRLFFLLALLSSRTSLHLPYDAIITVSEFSKMQLIENGINPDKIKIVPNGVDASFYESFEEKKYDRPTIVSVSRLSRKKRLHWLLETVNYLKKDIPDVQLVLIGKGPDESRLRKLASEYRLEKFVNFTGYVSEEEKARILKRSHVFCFPSEQEGFGLVAIESMACGLPVIASNIPVLREVLGSAALYGNSPREFAEMTKTLFTYPLLYDQHVAKSEEKAKEYTWDNAVSKAENVYESLR